MPNFVYLTGFEHGESPMSIAGQGLISGSSGAPTLVSGSLARSGEYALMINATGASKHVMLPSVRWTGASNTGNVVVGRFYFKFDSFPSSNRIMFVGGMAGIDCSMWYNSTGDGVLMGFDSPGTRLDYTAIVTGTWYRMDFRVDCSTSFYTVDWQLDGVDKAQNWYSGSAAQQISSTRFGNSGALTYKAYFDDIAISISHDDYPIGPGKVIGLRPSSDGTHNAGTNVMEDETGTDITTQAYSKLNENPWTTGSAIWVQQAANGTSNYVEVNFEDVPSGVTVQGVQGILGYRSATTTSNRGAGYILNTDGIGTELWGLPSGTKDYSEQNPFYRNNIIAAPAGGWTKPAVDGLVARLGYSDDASPIPYWLDVILEVAYAEPYDIAPSGIFVNTYVGNPTLSRSGTIAELDVETGDFSQFTAAITNGGRFAVSGSAAMANTAYGISVLHELGNTTAMYADKEFIQPEPTNTIRARFYLDPNTLGFTGSDTENVLVVRNSTSDWLFSVNFGLQGGNYVVRGELYDDAGVHQDTADYNITDAPHWIEVLARKATGPTSNDGYLQLWIDDASGTAVTTDDYDRWTTVKDTRFGAVGSIDTGTSGTFFLDELVINNTGDYIGPKPSGGPTVYSLSGTSITVNTYVGTPYLNQEHGLQASGIYCNTYVGNPYLNQEHALAASGIYVNTYVGTPYLNQEHALQASGIYVNTYVGNPYLSQEHALQASGIVVNTYVGNPYLSQEHALVASGIYVNTYVGNPYIGQEHGLSSTGLTVGSTVGTPYISQEHGLSAGGITSSPTCGTPGIGQEHGMGCAGITVGSTVGTPYLSQEHALTATGITVGSTVGTPYLNQEHGLGATGLTSTPTVGSCGIGQEHGLGGGGIVVGGECGTPYISQTHVLTAVGITVTTYVGNPSLAPEGTMVPTGITVTTYVGSPYINQEHILGSGGLASGPTVGTPYIGQEHVLGGGGITVGGTIGNPSLSAGSGLEPSGITVGGDLGDPSISQTHVFGSGGIGSGPVIGQPGPGQEHILTIGGITISSTVGSPTLVSPPVSGGLLMHPIFKRIDQGIEKGMMSL